MTLAEIAADFLKLVSAGLSQEAFHKYVHPDFVHHLVYIEDGRQSYLEATLDNVDEFPDKSYETLHAFGEGDMAAVHSKVVLAPKTYAVIHIFKFKEGKIIESWEASQEEIENSPNKDGLF